MYLRSITIKGFKSFPERTRLEFGPGVSVVVGPNGSGKSNITDAVLWALGEQSPVAVRGQSMQDVIFAGAPGRKAGTAAEVELVLDDSDGSLGLGAPEVSIVRRLDRGGEGEYRLAGARCRLVDVIEVLSDTGLGKEMHSVISQGRVESLVTSKPRDRRLLIEEAAGLGKHRKRRRRAQLKLARTQDNLDRALDVEREARSRLRPLKRQAEAAELHLRLERQTLEAKWELARDELRAHLASLALAEATSARTRVRREELERELAEVAGRREAAEIALAGRSARREELARRCFAAQAAADRIAHRALSARAALDDVRARVRRHRELLHTLRDQPLDALPDPDAQARIDRLESELAELERRREQALELQLAELEGSRRQAAAQVEVLGAGVRSASAAREAADRRLDGAREDLRLAERAVESARRDAARVGSELAACNHFLAVHSGSRHGRTLGDELEVTPGFELAVAAALEGRLRASVVDEVAEARALLDSAGAEGSRALVTGTLEGAVVASGQAAAGPGAEPLLSRVQAPARAQKLVAALLDGVWVVESLEQVPASFGGTAVTRSGRVWSPRTGELRQAPAAGEERVLEERNRRDELIAASELAANAELTAAAALDRAIAAAQQLEVEREAAIAAHRACVRDRDEAIEEERRLGVSIERRRAAPQEGEAEVRRLELRGELGAERRRQERLEREHQERAQHLERLEAAVAGGEAVLPGMGETEAALQAVAKAISVQFEVFERALAADREAGEEVAAQLRACAQQEAGLQSQLHGVSEALTAAEVARQRARDRAQAGAQELGALAGRLELSPEPAEQELAQPERESLTGRLERLARRREQLGPVNPLAQEEYTEALEHVEELERQRTDLETALKELERLIADTDRQITDSFERTFQAAAENFEAVVGQLFPGGSGRLRLVAEKEGPARVLGGGDGSGEAVGEEPGVEPEAEVQGEEDLLGVEIEIHPAGKEMKRLSLLSGGEKSMTALAFLFAVFLARPCPFYILDEVEAALDDLNIDRFLSLLRAYSQRAQFIVVTHQKRTMEAADFLYGVSMGGDGISKVISRRLPPEPEAGADQPPAAVADVAA